MGRGVGGGEGSGWESVFLIFTRESSYCTLQADKSFEPLPIILSEYSH